MRITFSDGLNEEQKHHSKSEYDVRHDKGLIEEYLIGYSLRDRVFSSNRTKKYLERKRKVELDEPKAFSLNATSKKFNYSRFHESKAERI